MKTTKVINRKISFGFLAGLITAIIVLFPNITSAQLRDDGWNSVVSLQSGKRLVVERDGMSKPTKGKFESADESTLKIRSDGRTTVIPKSEISAVYLGKRGSRAKRGVIGALAGAGAGVAIGSIVTVATKTNGLAAAAGFLYGIPVGAAIGIATGGGTRKDEMIYRR